MLKQKRFSLVLAVLMILSVFAPAVFAEEAGEPAMLTLDSDNFTIIDEIGTNKVIQLKALDSNYKPTTLSPTDKANAKWFLIGFNEKPEDVQDQTVTENNVVKLEAVDGEPDKVKIDLKGVGETKLVAKVDKRPDLGYIHSNIVVEKAGKGEAVNVSVRVDLPDKQGTYETIKVEPGEINNAKTLLKTPTALHALDAITNLSSEVESQYHGYSYEVAEGSDFVTTINGITPTWPAGWKFSVNGEEPDRSAGISALNNGDYVHWYYVEDMN